MSELGESECNDTNSKQTGSVRASSPYQPPASAGSDWAAFLGEDCDDLGDLRDVPQSHLHEVVDLIRSLPGPHDDPGAIDDLRSWIATLHHLAGFSREATLRLFGSIAQLLEAPRPPGYNLPTRVSLQQAFVRMRGVRETVDCLLLRLSDAVVVASACRVLAAAVQGSPLVAEFMLDDKPDNIRLLLRAIERHAGDFNVAENGCLLISHLCSQTPVLGSTASPARTKSHRDSQNILVREGGAVDLLVDILAASIDSIKPLTLKTESMHEEAILAANSMALKKEKESKVQTSVASAKNNIALKEAWEELNDLEALAARVQAAALQALLLLGFGNAETTRMLAGQFWCWGTQREVVEQTQHQEQSMKTQLQSRGRRAGVSSGKPDAGEKGKGKGKGAGGAKAQKKLPAANQEPVAQPTDEAARCALTSVEAFSKTCKLMVEVIQGRPSRDRPALAAQACRVLGLLVERGISMLDHIDRGNLKCQAELAVVLRPGPIPADDCKPEAPFAPLRALVAALTFAVRTHKSNPSLLAESMALFKRLKVFSLLSAPGGVETGGQELLYAWQTLVGEAMQEDELADAHKAMCRAVDNTDLGNEACIKPLRAGGTVQQLMGEAFILTPRMREFVAETSTQAAEIAQDALASRWRNGETRRMERKKLNTLPPGRERRQLDAASSPTNRGTAAQNPSTPLQDSLAQGRQRGTPEPSTSSSKQAGGAQGTPESTRPLRSAAGSADSGGPAAKLEPKKTAWQRRNENKVDETQKSVVREAAPEWGRAIGYYTYDENDFEGLWREPLTDAFQRSLSMPSIRAQRIRKRIESSSLTANAGRLESPEDEKQKLEIKFMSSDPGVLRAQLIVHAEDRHHQTVTDLRVKSLMDPDVSNAEVAPVIAKHLKKQGRLLPQYGVQVLFKRGRRNSALARTGSELLLTSS